MPKIFNQTSLILNLNYKKTRQIILSFLLKRMTKIIFWDLQKHFECHLRAKHLLHWIFRVFTKKKNEKLTILILIFSYEAVKYQKLSLFIIFWLSKKHKSFNLTPRIVFFFFDSKYLSQKGSLPIGHPSWLSK